MSPTNLEAQGIPASVLVVGGTGFMGSRLVRTLGARGVRVHLTYRAAIPTGHPSLTDPSVTAVRWRGDLETMTRLLVESQPEVIILLAAQVAIDHAELDIEPLISANVHLPITVMEAARKAGIRNFVTAGTFWEEWSEVDSSPANLYAATRSAAKQMLRYYASSGSWSAAHLRVSDLYGPGDKRLKLFHFLRDAVLSGVPLAMSPGQQLIDLVHVDDAAEAFIAASRRMVRSDTAGMNEYGVFANDPRTVREVVDVYSRVIGRPVPVDWGGRPYRAREVMIPRFIPVVPGWAVTYSLETGLLDMESGPGGLLRP